MVLVIFTTSNNARYEHYTSEVIFAAGFSTLSFPLTNTDNKTRFLYVEVDFRDDRFSLGNVAVPLDKHVE
jgi:hypothetical protein